MMAAFTDIDAPLHDPTMASPTFGDAVQRHPPATSDSRLQYGLPSSSQQSAQPLMGAPFDGPRDGATGKASATPPLTTKREAATAPAWSEMKTKAGKERKRLPLACIACRRKKIRCSGEKPACKHCLRSRIPCVYKVTTRKAAPRTDYMAMLDRRLKRMEERVIRVIPKDAQDAVIGGTRAVVKPAIPGAPSRKTSKDAKKRSADEAFEGDVEEWAASKDARQADSESALRPQQSDVEEQSLLKAGAESLPTMDIQEHLAEVFFDYVYGQAYFLLHKPSYMRKLKAGQLPPVLILCVCAMAARFSTHPAVRTEPAFLRGERWASPARDIALKRYDKPNITILICYLILGLHEFGTCQGGRSWMFGGMAQRMAYALQLHKELEHENWGKDQVGQSQKPRLSPTDQEIRRRTMWSCYMMDRFTSSGTDRPLFLWEKHINVQLPIKESYFQMETSGATEDMNGNVLDAMQNDPEGKQLARENTGLPGYTIRAAALWGRILDYMNFGGREADAYPLWDERSGFQRLLRQAKAFRDNIPSWFAYTPDNLQIHSSERTANQFIFLHIFAHQNILYLHRFGTPPATGSGTTKVAPAVPQDFLADTTKAALGAADQISALLVDAFDHRVVAPFAGYSAFLSSTVHIHGIFSKNPGLEATAKKNLAINVKYLSKMKRYWGMFHFITEQIKDQYRQQADSSSGSNGRKGSGIFQYGDWFDRYPSGVSSTDFEDPAPDSKKEPGTDAALSQKSEVRSMDEYLENLSPSSRREHPQTTAKTKKQVKSRAAPQQVTKQSQPAPAPAAKAQKVNPQQGLGISAGEPMYSSKSDYLAPAAFPDTPNVDWASLAQQTNFYPESSHMINALDRQLVMSSLGFDSLPTGQTPQARPEIVNAHPTQPMSMAHSLAQHPHQRNSATEALVQAQMRAQAQMQAQARLQQQQRQRQQQHQRTGQQPPTSDWASWDLSLDAHTPFDPAAAASGFGNGMDWSGAPGTAWFMPFNLQPPDLGVLNVGGGGGAAAAHGMWDDVFAMSDSAQGASSNSGIGGMDVDEDVSGLASAFGSLSEVP